ncbi:hypothetical protein [Kitasatospora sp. NPDC006786]|uniref:hypothetical protein n=1 Tax=unclassified Kitasatospora TaxID=2633591 RepID=UPI0033E56ED0
MTEIACIDRIETAAERHGARDDEHLVVLAPAAAAALRLLADAIKRGGADQDDVVEALKSAGVHEAFADVLGAAADAVMDGLEDPYEFDGRLHADNLSGAAIQVRDAFAWL